MTKSCPLLIVYLYFYTLSSQEPRFYLVNKTWDFVLNFRPEYKVTKFLFLFDKIKHRRKKNLVWVNKLSYLNPEGKNIYRVDKLSYQTSSLAKEITLSLDQRVQFERWALTSKLIISLQLVNAVAKRKEKKNLHALFPPQPSC